MIGAPGPPSGPTDRSHTPSNLGDFEDVVSPITDENSFSQNESLNESVDERNDFPNESVDEGNVLITSDNLQLSMQLWFHGIYPNGKLPNLNTTHCAFEINDLIDRFIVDTNIDASLHSMALELSAQLTEFHLPNTKMLTKFRHMIERETHSNAFDLHV